MMFLSLFKRLMFLFLASAQAAYTIDDTNSTIQYIPNGRGGLQWHIASIPEINLTASFDQTTTVGECNYSQNCHLRIPFTGSGITIYVVQVNFAGINASIIVDTLAPQTRTFLEPLFYQHNFPLFDSQELPWGDHIVDVALLDCQYNASNLFSYPNGTSGLAFDYAVINDQQLSPAVPPMTSPSVTSTLTPSSSSHTRTVNTEPIGAIVGGAIGGLVVLMALILLLLYFRGRRPKSNDRPIRRGTEIEPRRDSGQVSPFVQRNGYAPAGGPQLFQSTMPFIPPAVYTPGDHRDPTRAWLTAQYAHPQPVPSSHNAPISFPSIPSINALDPSHRISASSAGEPSEARSLSPVSTRLTGDQLESAHNLHNLNAPAAEISSAVERMRAEREVGLDETMNLGQNNVMASGVLPRYDSAQFFPE